MTITTASDREAWRRDGIVCIRDVLSDATLALARQALDWSIAHPGPNSFRRAANGAAMFQDRANPAALAVYATLARQPEFKAVLNELWGETEVWFIFEQVFTRQGGALPATPWHQDTLYMPTKGEQLATVWFCLGEIPQEAALEMAVGSHRGPIYNGIKAHPDEGSVPLFDRADMPPLPDIEAQRPNWNIVSHATAPRDLLIFHPSIVHGGGGNTDAVSRETITLRFFGEDVLVSDVGDGGAYRCSTDRADPDYHPVAAMYTQTPGRPFRNPDFPQL